MIQKRSNLALALPLAALALAPAGVCVGQAESTAVLRGVPPATPPTVVAFDQDGVTIRGVNAPERRESWDRVERIDGAMAAQAGAFANVAETAWRARTRLERGDAVAAEAYYEELFKTYAGRSGPTPAAVAEGLLRCRLRRGAHGAAIGAWLAWVEAGAPVKEYAAAANARDIPDSSLFIDPETGLTPLLPPVWVNTPATQALARGDLFPKNATTGKSIFGVERPDTKAGILAAWYLRAAQFEAGLAMIEPPASNPDPAIALVANIVMARTGDAEPRRAARQWLRSRLSASPPVWQEAWIRVAIGRSLLQDTAAADDEALLGVAELLHLPARLERSNPYLTGVALAEAAVALRRFSDTRGGYALRQHLIDAFPGHPVLDWERIRGWAPPSPQDQPKPDNAAGLTIESLPTPSGEDAPARKTPPGGRR